MTSPAVTRKQTARDRCAAERIVEVILAWARAQPEIRAVALVGSHARGTARPESDIDLVVLTAAPNLFRTDTQWPHAIDWNAIGASPEKWQDEDYGVLWSRRLWLAANHTEVEIGFASPAWADVTPLDPGTHRVIADGCRILLDPDGLLTRLCAAAQSGPPVRSRSRSARSTTTGRLPAVARADS